MEGSDTIGESPCRTGSNSQEQRICVPKNNARDPFAVLTLFLIISNETLPLRL